MASKMAKLKCGGKFLKYFLAIVNIIFFILGLIIAGVAGYAAFAKNSTIHRMLLAYHNQTLIDGLYILLAVGLFLAIISFFGMWGALAENRVILFIYLFVIIIIFALQLAGIIMSFVEFRKIEAKVIGFLKDDAMVPANSTHEVAKIAVVSAIYAIQEKFHCCGITGPDNYKKDHLPDSCFAPAATGAPGATPSPDVRGMQYKLGCIDSARPYLYAAGGIAIAVLFLQILIILFTCCLITDIKEGYQAVQ